MKSSVKRTLAALAFSVLTVTSVSAQAVRTGWEVVGGVDSSSFTTEGITGLDSIQGKAGFSLGGLYSFRLDARSALKIGGIARLVSGKLNVVDHGNNRSQDFNMASLEMPIEYHYALDKNWGVFGGGYVGHALNRWNVLGDSFTAGSHVGLNAGVSYSLNQYNFELSYRHALSNSISGYDKLSVKPSAVSFRIGYEI